MMRESPGDLAVAFRSFGRRLAEALAPLHDNPALVSSVSPSPRELTKKLSDLLAAAAQEVHGVSSTDDVAATGAAIADAIAATPADAWDAARLDRLRAITLDAGRVLREIDAAVRSAMR